MRHRRLGEIRREAEVVRGAWREASQGLPRAPAPTLLRRTVRPLRAPATEHPRSPRQQSVGKAGREHFAVAAHFPLYFLAPGPAALPHATMGSIPRYPRSYGPRMSWGRMLTPAIRNIIIARTGVFLVQTLLNLFASPAAQR